ncbi:MAG: hypothetical protein JXR69_04805 [Candidatus Delongbacteria bacterium]|nr:hypothetical protein [Candidatus Delongbacteria bacterium]
MMTSRESYERIETYRDRRISQEFDIMIDREHKEEEYISYSIVTWVKDPQNTLSTTYGGY